MKIKIGLGIFIALVIAFFLFSGNEEKAPAVKEAQNENQENGELDSVEKQAAEISDGQAVENSMVDDEGKELSPMDQLLKKVNSLSMFNQQGLDALREEAYSWMQENPKEFEEFTLKQVRNADKNSVESMFFFVEAYAKKHPNPSEGINEILKMESTDAERRADDHEQVGGTQKQNMTKAFALEVFFDRIEESGGASSEDLAKIEGSIKDLVEKESDLMMVRQGLMVLRNYMDYPSEQLQEIIDRRGSTVDESHSYSDLLKE